MRESETAVEDTSTNVSAKSPAIAHASMESISGPDKVGFGSEAASSCIGGFWSRGTKGGRSSMVMWSRESFEAFRFWRRRSSDLREEVEIGVEGAEVDVSHVSRESRS